MAQRLLKKDALRKNGGKGSADVDESMFVQIDSPGQNEVPKEKEKSEEIEARVKDEL